MSAYIVVQIDVHDPVRYEDYKKAASVAVEQYGGRYLVRGGKVETLEGDWAPGRFVVLEFPSAEQAKAWYNCEEYRAPRQLRHETADSQMIVVEGVAPA